MESSFTSVRAAVTRTSYHLAWGGEKYSALFLDIFARSFLSHPDIIGNDISDYIGYFQNRNYMCGLYSDEEYKRITEKHGSYFLIDARIEALPAAYNAMISEIEDFYLSIEHTQWKDESNARIAETFRRYVTLMEHCAALFRMTREESEIGPTEYMRHVLMQQYRPDEIEGVLRTLATSPEEDVISKERSNWLGLLCAGWDDERALRHARTYPALVTNFYGRYEVLSSLKRRYEEDLRRIEVVESEIAAADKAKLSLRAEQQAIYERCSNDTRLIRYAQMLQTFGTYRFKLKHYWAGSEFPFFPVYEEIARRMGMSIKDFFDVCEIDDVLAYLKSGRLLADREIENRRRCIVVAVKNGELYFFSGQEAEEVVTCIHYEKTGSGVLTGRTAYPGLVTGIVRIVHTLDMDELTRVSSVFKKGDILVTGNTDPTMVTLMKKAGAIVAMAGGITSHAAIVSREYKVPCVVGVRDAMQVLREGDTVEVNAHKGVVRVIPPP